MVLAVNHHVLHTRGEYLYSGDIGLSHYIEGRDLPGTHHDSEFNRLYWTRCGKEQPTVACKELSVNQQVPGHGFTRVVDVRQGAVKTVLSE